MYQSSRQDGKYRSTPIFTLTPNPRDWNIYDIRSASNVTAFNVDTGSSSVVDAQRGSWQSPKVLSINRYALVLPGDFLRQVVIIAGPEDTFPSTSVPADPIEEVAKAEFHVFDQIRAKGILGNSPTLEIMFNTTPASHDGPLYVPGLRRLYAAQVVLGFCQQAVVDLSVNPPQLEYLTADPPLYACTGGSYRANLIYLACASGNSMGTKKFRPGILHLNTGKSNVL